MDFPAAMLAARHHDPLRDLGVSPIDFVVAVVVEELWDSFRNLSSAA